LVCPPRALKNVIVGVALMPLASTVRPGVALRRLPTVRAPGTDAMTSWSSTVSRLTLCRSTTGVSLVTVIVSSRPPTLSWNGMVRVADPPTWTLSCLIVLNPGSVAVTE
jgi:hypothetical protein